MVGFSPDGKKLLWMGEDARSFALRDAGTGEPVLLFRVPRGTVHPVAFSPDGKYIASLDSPGDDPPSLGLWDAATGKELRKLPTPARNLEGQPNDVTEPVFSPDGKWLAAASVYDGVLHVWDVETGQGPRAGGRSSGRRLFRGLLAGRPNGAHGVYGRDRPRVGR